MAKRLCALLALATMTLVVLVMGTALPAAGSPGAAAIVPDGVPTPSLYAVPNQRIGVGLVRTYGDVTTYDVSQLGAGWYADWTTRLSPPHPNGMEFVQLINTASAAFPPNWTTLGQKIAANPGSTWIVGNEPEAAFQENHTPAEYAVMYHDIYAFVKATDPTAQVAIAGVIIPSPLRLQWLDMVLSEYQSRYGVAMPVDVWNTHMQIVQEVSCAYDPSNCWGAEIPAGISATVGITMNIADNASYDLFVQLTQAMRTWMNARGFRDKPLIISEYGVLFPSSYLCDQCGENPALGDAIVASFMTRTFSYMLNTTDANIGMPADGNRLVQRWMWYTLNDQPYNFDTGLGFNGGLFDYRNNVYPGTITYFGKVFGDFVRPLMWVNRVLLPVIVSNRAFTAY
jgi:hypothetical protein